MRTIHKILIGGVCAAVLAGAAIAASHKHVMTVKLSDGEVAHITYFGDTAPRVQVVQGQAERIAFAGDALSPFADIDRISALMDAHMSQMMQQASAMQSQVGTSMNGTPHVIAFSNLPKGAHVQYSYTSTTVGANGCARTVSWQSDGGTNAQPKMIQTSSGACGVAKDGAEAKPLMTSGSKAQEALAHPI
jgi:hypothetical protein